jgi:hypothetical protein
VAAEAVWDRKLLATALRATVPRMASPIEPPTCWPTSSRLEATIPDDTMITATSGRKVMPVFSSLVPMHRLRRRDDDERQAQPPRRGA